MYCFVTIENAGSLRQRFKLWDKAKEEQSDDFSTSSSSLKRRWSLGILRGRRTPKDKKQTPPNDTNKLNDSDDQSNSEHSSLDHVGSNADDESDDDVMDDVLEKMNKKPKKGRLKKSFLKTRLANTFRKSSSLMTLDWEDDSLCKDSNQDLDQPPCLTPIHSSTPLRKGRDECEVAANNGNESFEPIGKRSTGGVVEVVVDVGQHSSVVAHLMNALHINRIFSVVTLQATLTVYKYSNASNSLTNTVNHQSFSF